MAEGDGACERILIVEDHGPTANLMVRALNEVAPGVTCIEVRTAGQALDFLTRSNEAAPTPDLVLLDLDLPDRNGLDVLKALNSHPKLCRIPVLVISSDERPETIDRCYEHAARTFIKKPEEWDEFAAVAQAIGDYWFDIAATPSTTSCSEATRESLEIE